MPGNFGTNLNKTRSRRLVGAATLRPIARRGTDGAFAPPALRLGCRHLLLARNTANLSAGFTQLVLENQAIAQSWIADVKLEIELAGLAHARGKGEVMSPKHNLLMRDLKTSSIS